MARNLGLVALLGEESARKRGEAVAGSTLEIYGVILYKSLYYQLPCRLVCKKGRSLVKKRPLEINMDVRRLKTDCFRNGGALKATGISSSERPAFNLDSILCNKGARGNTPRKGRS